MLGILIPTKNRPEHVQRLLKSISRSDLSDSEIVLVASGLDIKYIVDSFENELKIKYFHVNQSGQINQKMIGISKFGKNVEWIMFLDDDLLVSQNLSHNIRRSTLHLKNAIGIGLKLPMKTRFNKKSRIMIYAARIFLLDSSEKGKLLKSGHAVSYMESSKILETKWLSGASIWKTEIAKKYNSVHPFSRYAAYEDVIFSHQVANLGTLYFDPALELNFQEKQPEDITSTDAFISANYWRYFLVCSDEYFNFIQFLWSQLGRTIFFVLNHKNGSSIRILKSNLNILLNKVLRKSSITLLKKFC